MKSKSIFNISLLDEFKVVETEGRKVVEKRDSLMNAKASKQN
jgi:hypothetical protein